MRERDTGSPISLRGLRRRVAERVLFGLAVVPFIALYEKWEEGLLNGPTVLFFFAWEVTVLAIMHKTRTWPFGRG